MRPCQTGKFQLQDLVYSLVTMHARPVLHRHLADDLATLADPEIYFGCANPKCEVK